MRTSHRTGLSGLLASRAGGGYPPGMAPTPRDAATTGDGGASTYTMTLHVWTPGRPADPNVDQQIQAPMAISDTGGEAKFPPLAEPALVYIALWLGSAPMWHSEVIAADVNQQIGLQLSGPMPGGVAHQGDPID